MLLSLTAYGQSGLIGQVTDNEGQTLPGVNVLIKGTTIGVVTDANGRFVLDDVSDDAVIVFSFIGFKTTEVPRKGQGNLQVKMLPDIQVFEEVVVVGYGTQKKSIATASLSKVDSKDLAGFSVPRLDQMLQGQVSGVTFKAASGQPGSAMNIFIRGVGTNGDNSPLIIVDGIVVNDRILEGLNPADVESVQVLKDGASTAIYGSRGANGVIMVTTRRAKAGTAKFSYSSVYGVQQPWRIPSMLDANEYVALITEKYDDSSVSLPAGFPDQNNITANTDWMDELFETGSTQSHSISLQKGTENGSVFSSLSYFNQTGVIAPDKSNFKRITARFNSENQINEYVTFGQNLFLLRSINERIPENSEFGTPIGDALVYDPIAPARDAGREYGFGQSFYVQQEYVNPLSRIFISNTTNNTDEVIGNAFLKVAPVKWLSVQSDIGVDYIYYTGKGFTPSHALTDVFFNTLNDIYQYENKAVRWQWENFATFTHAVGSHHGSLVIGTTSQVRNNGTGFAASSSGIPADVQFNRNFWYIAGTPDSLQRSTSFGAEKQSLRSFFGRVNYDYEEKYLVSLTLRRDGSSQFGLNNRYGNFPSASVGWVVSRETFWPQTAANFLKVRASYGVNGNDRIPTLAYASLIETTGAYPFGKPGSQTIYNGQSSAFSPNPNLRWEESKQLDVGIEVGLWNDLVTLELDYYNKTTSGLLMSATVPDYIGTRPPIANVGEVVNKGFELEGTFAKTFGIVNLRIGLTAATLKNEVTEVNEDGYQEGYTWPVRNTTLSRMELGHPIGFFRGHKTGGVFKTQNEIFAHINSDGEMLQPNARPGDIRFIDTNKDGVVDGKDIVEIGKPWADVIFGFTGSVAYKGFNLKFVLAGSLGNDVFRSYERQDVVNNNYSEAWLDRWSETNPGGSYPRLVINDNNNNSRPSDFYVEDASFIRLRNIQLGYSFPSAWLKAIKMSSLHLYISADNLLTITGYTGFDPEIGTSGWILDTGIDKGFYPQMKTVSAGLNLSF